MRRPSFLQSMGRTNHYNNYVRRINRHLANYLNFILKKKKKRSFCYNESVSRKL